MKTTMKNLTLSLILTAAVLAMTSVSQATVIGGIDFPQGNLSFADAVVSFTPHVDTPDPSTGTGQSPDVRWRNPADALGAPNYTAPAPGKDYNLGQFVSLGNGQGTVANPTEGVLVLQFVDNRLTGSGNAKDDLYVFEVGAVVESTYVWISQNGSTWLSVGHIGGSTRGIDIDPYLTAAGLSAFTQFSYVRLWDDPADFPMSGTTPLPYGVIAGADIDAVGAISSVPEPATLVLMAVAGTVLVARRRQMKSNTL